MATQELNPQSCEVKPCDATDLIKQPRKIHCQRADPSTYISGGDVDKFWEAYSKMKNQFKMGEYVVFEVDKFLFKSDTRPEYHYVRDYDEKDQFYFKEQFCHKVTENDVEIYQFNKQRYAEKLSVRKETIDKLLEILIDEEKYSGNKYELEIRQHQVSKELKLNEFKKRNSYTVFLMKPDYKDIEGTYSSLKEIEKKIELNDLKFAEELKETTRNDHIFISWKCPQCHTFGGDEKDPLRNYSGNELCQKTGCGFHGPYRSRPTIDLKSGTLYTSSGGSIGFCTTVGFIKIN